MADNVKVFKCQDNERLAPVLPELLRMCCETDEPVGRPKRLRQVHCHNEPHKARNRHVPLDQSKRDGFLLGTILFVPSNIAIF